jgi:hypothetical protein
MKTSRYPGALDPDLIAAVVAGGLWVLPNLHPTGGWEIAAFEVQRGAGLRVVAQKLVDIGVLRDLTLPRPGLPDR